MMDKWSEIWDNTLEFVQEYWALVISVIVIIGVGFYGISTTNAINLAKEQEKSSTAELVKVARDLKVVNETKPSVVEVTQSTINARTIGSAVVKDIQTLAPVYMSAGSLSEADREKSKEPLKNLATNVAGDPMANIWLRNPAWKLELKSVVNYKGVSKMPVIFMMTTSSGSLAGLVKTTYDADKKQFENVTVNYTAAGKADFADVGGR